MRRMSKAGYSESYRHDVLTSAVNIYEKKLKDEADGTCPLNPPPGYKMIERRKLKRDKKRNWTGKKGRGGIPIIIPATEGSSLLKEMRKVAEAVSRENPDIVFSIVERGGVSVERMLMKTNPTESEHCGRDCFGCNQGGEHKNMCRKSNVLYNWECNETECDAGYDGQSSKNNFTRSGQHISLYNNWVRHDDGSVNPRSGKGYAKPQSTSFLYEHQNEDHNGAPPDFKLQSKRYYGRDRLACQVAEGVSIKMRTGKILNSKTDWDAPSLITLERNVRMGL